MPLSLEKIQQLQAKQASKSAVAWEPEIKQGPVRPLLHTDKTRRCVQRKCMTPAGWSVKGIPYCVIHAMYALNALVVEASGEEVTWKKPDPMDRFEVLELLYDVRYSSAILETEWVEKIDEFMNQTHYPSLRKQLDRIEAYRNGDSASFDGTL